MPKYESLSTVAQEAVDYLENEARKVRTRTLTVESLIASFEEISQEFQPVDINKLTHGMNKTDIVTRGLTDLNFYSKFHMPETCVLDFPLVFLNVWDVWTRVALALRFNKGTANIATAFPRGYTKTTLEKLHCGWLFQYTRHTFIVNVGETNEKAQRFASDIMESLRAPQLLPIYGSIDANKIADNNAYHEFDYCGKRCILLPRGILTSTRGLQIHMRRPDVTMGDDMQSEENAASIVQSAALRSWYINTLLPAESPLGGIHHYVCNAYPYEGSMLKLLQRMDNWLTLSLGAILEDGSALWEELHPRAKTITSYRQAKVAGQRRAWLAQYQNITEDISTLDVDLPLIQSNVYKALGHLLGVNPDGSLVDATPEELSNDWDENVTAVALIVDVAGSKETADDHSFTVVQEVQGHYVAREIVSGIYTPKQAIVQVMNLVMKYNIPYVFVESVAYQASFVFWGNYFAKEAGVQGQVRFVEITPENGAKNFRITTSFQQLEEGEMLLHPDVFPKYKAQATAFDPNISTNKDDVLDGVHYIPQVMNMYAPYIRAKYESVKTANSLAAAIKKREHQLNSSEYGNKPL